MVGANEGRLTLVDGGLSQFEPGLCSTEALETHGRCLSARSRNRRRSSGASPPIAADQGFSSTAALPLIVENAPIAVLEFHFSAPVNFDDEYQALLISVAQHCTQALDRARLYEQAQRARAEAEAANRLKDEFVSTVSHELRTPLNAILGWASMLRTGSIDSEVVPQALESIYRNASRQAKLVDDLLDFSRMAGGRTTLDVENIDAPNLIRGIVESVIPLAAGSQIEIQLSAIPEAHASRRRAPARAGVRQSARQRAQVHACRRTDHGVGADIAGTFLRSASPTTGSASMPSFCLTSSTGSGRATAPQREIIRASGWGCRSRSSSSMRIKGTIRVESGGSGKGTAFTVSLPTEGVAGDAAGSGAGLLSLPGAVHRNSGM